MAALGQSASAMIRQPLTWTRRQWKVAGWAYLGAFAFMGIAGDTLPGFHGVVPVEWWNYLTLALSPPLIALIVASFVPSGQPRWARRRQATGAGVGGVAGTLAMACPVCNPLAIPLFGASGVLSFLAPERGLIALLSVVLLAVTLAVRLRATQTCRVNWPSTPTPAGDDHAALAAQDTHLSDTAPESGSGQAATPRVREPHGEVALLGGSERGARPHWDGELLPE